MNRKTLMAKAAYKASGKLAKIKTPQRFSTYKGIDKHGRAIVERDGKRRWFMCPWSVRLLDWSMHLDPKHWDHWALVHDGCDADLRCRRCGGTLCPNAAPE